MAFFDQGGVMNKSYPILLLLLLQCACASQPVPVEASNSLISFNDIASEITVNFQKIDGDSDALTATADINESVAQVFTESP